MTAKRCVMVSREAEVAITLPVCFVNNCNGQRAAKCFTCEPKSPRCRSKEMAKGDCVGELHVKGECVTSYLGDVDATAQQVVLLRRCCCCLKSAAKASRTSCQRDNGVIVDEEKSIAVSST